jgi:hypothetical protein
MVGNVGGEVGKVGINLIGITVPVAIAHGHEAAG